MMFWLMFAFLLLVASGFMASAFLPSWRGESKNATAAASIERVNVSAVTAPTRRE